MVWKSEESSRLDQSASAGHARHTTSYGREEMIFDPSHYLSLLEQKINDAAQPLPAPDRSRDRRQRCVGDVIPIGESLAQVRIGTIAVGVVRVLREHRKDELVQRSEAPRWRRLAPEKPG